METFGNGHGTAIYDNGNKYEGEFQNNKFNCHGTYTFSNGDKDIGEWKNDRFITKKMI